MRYFSIILFIYLLCQSLLAAPVQHPMEREAVHMVNNSFGIIQDYTEAQINCQEAILPPSCPSALGDIIENDFSRGMTHSIAAVFLPKDMEIKAPMSYCKGLHEREESSFENASEMERYFSSHPEMDMGFPSNYLTSSTEGCYPKITQEHLRSVGIQQQGKPYGPDDANRILVGEFYVSQKRLHDSGVQILDEMKGIDFLLGKKTIEDINCEELHIPKLKKNCEKKKEFACESQGHTADLAKEIEENAIKPIKELKAHRKQILAGAGHQGAPPSQEDIEEAEYITSLIKAIEATYPWINGEEFQEEQVKGASIEKALTAQLKKDRKVLKDKLEKENDASICLSTNNGECDDLHETLKKTPKDVYDYRFVHHDVGRSKDRVFDDISAKSAVALQQCLVNTRESKEESAEILQDLALNSALTIMTGGASALVRLGLAGKKGVMAKRFALGMDSAHLGMSLNNAVDSCTAENYNVNLGLQESQNTCPKSGSSNYSIIKEQRSCLVAVLFSAVDALPFTPAMASKFLGPKKKYEDDVIKRIEALTGKPVAPGDRDRLLRVWMNSRLSDEDRLAKALTTLDDLDELTPQMKKAIIEAHEVGDSIFKFSKAELRQKEKILLDAGFSKAQVTKLMREGITGKPPGSSIADIHKKNVDDFVNDAKDLQRADGRFSFEGKPVALGQSGVMNGGIWQATGPGGKKYILKKLEPGDMFVAEEMRNAQALHALGLGPETHLIRSKTGDPIMVMGKADGINSKELLIPNKRNPQMQTDIERYLGKKFSNPDEAANAYLQAVARENPGVYDQIKDMGKKLGDAGYHVDDTQIMIPLKGEPQIIDAAAFQYGGSTNIQPVSEFHDISMQLSKAGQ